jgi:hypothetical protein
LPAITDFQRGYDWPFPGEPQPVAADSDSTLGWSFAVTAPVKVVRLGFYDEGGAGLTEPHRVGIWDDQAQLLGSVIVDRGEPGILAGGYRYISASAILLEPGRTYTIGATVPLGIGLGQMDFYPYYDVWPDTIVTDPRVVPESWSAEYRGHAGVSGSQGLGTLHCPSPITSTGRFLAANFAFEEIPEPATGWLALALAATVRRRSNVAAPRKASHSEVGSGM